ncbi:hypothetical protein J2X11_001641 [Aeromicrobium panaciterrae]|uniref:Uncharacterized protein n=1 Tax=Aeromicrobium panaciterrae TaxID=363861 RepID=A0ABU1UNP2_9ACTN|nr:hypothetical protein [Aeromicrobium panaciterrae]MDR7086802.1 hypothetical protein [Aeromicrobium panaciterrae]
MTETPADDVTTPEPESAEVESTGNERIDEALKRLESLDELDINDHPEQFDAIHQALRESLASAGRDGDAPESP